MGYSVPELGESRRRKETNWDSLYQVLGIDLKKNSLAMIS